MIQAIVSTTDNQPETTPLKRACAARAIQERVPRSRRGAGETAGTSGASDNDEATFLELRRKVQSGELLSASTEKLLWNMKFSGHLTLIVQHGRVVKSGYQEGYFRRKNDLAGMVFET